MTDKFMADTTKEMVSHLSKENIDESTKMAQFTKELQAVRHYDQDHGRNFGDDVKTLNHNLHKAGLLGGMTIVEDGKDVAVSKDASLQGILRTGESTAMDGFHAVRDSARGTYKLATGDFDGAGSAAIDLGKNASKGVVDANKTVVDSFKTVFGL